MAHDMTIGKTRASRRPPRWLGPGFALTAIFAVTLVLFMVIPEDDFRRVFRSPKVDTLSLWGYGIWTYGWMMMGIAICYMFVPRGGLWVDRRNASFDYAFMRFLGYVSLWLALGAYTVYYMSAGISLDAVIVGFSGEVGASYRLRKQLENIPGVTSLMNVAPWWYAYVLFKRLIVGEKLSRFELGISVVLLVMVTLRAFAAFERRAIFDLFIPSGILLLLYKRDWPATARRLLSFLPVLGVSFVIVIFLAGEYFKSWINYYATNSGMGFLQFGLTRLAGYYATAVNNAVLAIEDGIQTAGRLSLDGIYKFPGLRPLLDSGDDSQFSMLLDRLANPEFNNPGGAMATIVDYGLWGSAVFLLLHGLLFAWFYKGSAQRLLLPTLLYSMAYFSILESTRIWFFLSSFGVLNLGYLPLVYLLFRYLPRKIDISMEPQRALPSATAG